MKSLCRGAAQQSFLDHVQFTLLSLALLLNKTIVLNLHFEEGSHNSSI